MKKVGLTEKEIKEIEKFKNENGITDDPENIVPSEECYIVPLKEDE